MVSDPQHLFSTDHDLLIDVSTFQLQILNRLAQWDETYENEIAQYTVFDVWLLRMGMWAPYKDCLQFGYLRKGIINPSFFIANYSQ